MRESKKKVILWITAAACLVNLALGWLLANTLIVSGGAVGLCYVVLQVVYRRRALRMKVTMPTTTDEVVVAARPVPACGSRQAVDPNDVEALVDQLLAQYRYPLLLRPQIIQNLTESQFRRALTALEEGMALVPDGEVALGRIDEAPYDGELDDRDPDESEVSVCTGQVVQVDRFFLDRYPVTNRQFYEFVAAGGYEKMSLWEESIWPAVLDFVDRAGAPGPRYWKDGCYLRGQGHHPVVGVSWHEAAAYARWVGKRLPTDAEWVKAGSWPVSLSATTRQQRKYPWGDTMDPTRANLWSSGAAGIVAVDRFAKGVSVGGVCQLVGNVWEWTSGDFHTGDRLAEEQVAETPLKNIRGGAFDTYFDHQATCLFPSGEQMLARKHNIGFRLAVGACDIVLACPATAPSAEDAGQTKVSVEEVAV